MVVFTLAGLTVGMATPSYAAECPPGRPLCRVLTVSTTPTTAPAPILTATTVPPPPVPPPLSAAPRPAPEAAQRLLDLANGERARAGLGRLISRDDVVAIALGHGHRMAASGTIFHNDSYFTDPVQRLLNSKARGENVAQNSSVDETHARLMNSPGHRANILDSRFTVAGFAVVQAPDGHYYTTQNFLQPAGAVTRDPAAVVAPSAARGAPAQASVSPPAPAIQAVPDTAVGPTAPGKEQELNGGMAHKARVPDTIGGPEGGSRGSTGTSVPAGVLLGLVAIGVLQVNRHRKWELSSAR